MTEKKSESESESGLKLLYHFYNSTINIYEVKRLDVTLEEAKSHPEKVYFWIMHTRDTPCVRLKFTKMSDGFREFEQGQLFFHQEDGSATWQNSNHYLAPLKQLWKGDGVLPKVVVEFVKGL